MKRVVPILLLFTFFLFLIGMNGMNVYALEKPSNFSVKTKGYAVILDWKSIKGVSGYQVFYSTSKNGKFQYLSDEQSSKFTHKNLIMNKSYYYKVRSYTVGKTIKYSGYSKIISAKTKIVAKPKVYLKLSITYGIPARKIMISIANASEKNITVLTKGRLEDYFYKEYNRNLTMVDKVKNDYYYTQPFILKPNQYIFPVYYVVNDKPTTYDSETSKIKIYYNYEGKTFSKTSTYYDNEKYNRFVYGE